MKNLADNQTCASPEGKSNLFKKKKKTFSRRIAHYGTTGNFSLPAVSATGGQQALRHSWTRRTLVCSANAKNSTAGLLIVKWIQLLLVFSEGF